MTSDKLIHHLLWRTGFGPYPGKLYGDYQAEVNKVLKPALFEAISIPDWTPLDVSTIRKLDTAGRKEYQKKERLAHISLGYYWFQKMASVENPFTEKMAFFWSGHFACRINNTSYGLLYVNGLRNNALGNFGDLLRVIIRSAALLQFLNNNQNRKGNPNENFAREFFELFTLGRGNYSETDVKEAARSLTGWSFEHNGSFAFRKQLHDDGLKTVFGKTGSFDGDDLVDLVLARKECATFISYKLCRYFQSDIPDTYLVQQVAEVLFSSGYNIASAMRHILNAPQFKSMDSIGTKIKSPLELLVGLSRIFSLQFEQQTALIQLQRTLGQVMLNPPNVAGWPGGRSWIDSSTLMYRLRLPEVLLQNADTIFEAKAEFDVQQPNFIPVRKVKTSINPLLLWESIKDLSPELQRDSLFSFLLQLSPNEETIQLVNQTVTDTSSIPKMMQYVIKIMSLPEFQVC